MATNVSNELIIEHLKSIQARLTNLENGQAAIKTTLVGMQQHMAGFMTTSAAHESSIASLDNRVARIEKRLDLTD